MNKIYEIKAKKFITELPTLYPDYLIDYNTKTKTLVFTNKSLTKGEQWTVQIDTYNNINDLQHWINSCIVWETYHKEEYFRSLMELS